MVKAFLLAITIGVASSSAQSEVISSATALAMAEKALNDAGLTDAEPIAPSRSFPDCFEQVSIGPQSGDWSTISFRCDRPTWTRSLRTRSRSVAGGMPEPAQSETGNSQMAFGLIKSLAKDTKLTAEDIVLVPISEVGPDQVFTSPENLIGRRLNRALSSGQPVLARHLQPDWKILLGQTVLITSGGKSVNVAMQGRALENGAIGDLINVENLSSGRILPARVIQQDIVEVLLKPFGNGS